MTQIGFLSSLRSHLLARTLKRYIVPMQKVIENVRDFQSFGDLLKTDYEIRADQREIT